MKKLIAAICAVALALALPLTAFAEESPVVVLQTVNGDNGTMLTVSGTRANGIDLIVEPSSRVAANVPSGITPICTYDAYYTDYRTDINGNLILSFYVGIDNAGRSATVYIEHGVNKATVNGSDTEVKTTVVSNDGYVTVTVDGLSVYSIVLGDKSDTNPDKSATSPKTGMDMTGAAAVAGICLIGAGAAFAVRRKLN